MLYTTFHDIKESLKLKDREEAGKECTPGKYYSKKSGITIYILHKTDLK